MKKKDVQIGNVYLKKVSGQRTSTSDGYSVKLQKWEARLLLQLLTLHVDYPELGTDYQRLYDKLEAVL